MVVKVFVGVGLGVGLEVGVRVGFGVGPKVVGIVAFVGVVTTNGGGSTTYTVTLSPHAADKSVVKIPVALSKSEVKFVSLISVCPAGN